MAIQPFNNQQLVLLPIKLLTLPRFSVMNGHFEASVVLVKAGRKFLHLSSLYLYVVLSKDDVVIVIWSKGFHSCRLADVFSLSHPLDHGYPTRCTAGPAERKRENCL